MLAVYEVAYNLKMLVADVQNKMSYTEFLGWLAYFEKRPVGWRDDDRAAKLIQAQGVKEPAWKLFPSLNAIYNPAMDNTDPGKTSKQNLMASAIFHKLVSAKGGDKIDFTKLE